MFEYSRPSENVSTHSRPKAAGSLKSPCKQRLFCFNTQPPEGGWMVFSHDELMIFSFNTQPPEGGWFMYGLLFVPPVLFQHTAARRRLAYAQI